MPLKLTSKEKADKLVLTDELRKATDAVVATTDTDTIHAYNVIAADIEEFVGDVAARLREEFEGKSEKWQESDAAAEVNDLIDNWESCTIEVIDGDNVEESELESTLDIFENLPEDIG